MPTIPSKEQWKGQQKDFALLPRDYYTLSVFDLKKEQRQKYKSSEMEDVVNIQFEIVSLRDGSKALDVDGGSTEKRRVFFTARPNKLGFKEKGTIPSGTRQFLAYITNNDPFIEFTFGEWEEFVGKRIDAEIIQYQKEDGKMANKISSFLPSKKKNEAKVEINNDIPIIEEPMPSKFEFPKEEGDIDVDKIPF